MKTTKEWLTMSILRVVQDEVEFFTHISNGACKMSESGMARICDITQQSMYEKIQTVLTGKLNSKCLKEFAGKDLSQQETLKINGLSVNLNLHPSNFCAAMIEHYAFESRHKTKAALFAYRKFARIGIEAWIQGITGWQPHREPAEPTFEAVDKFITDRIGKGLMAAAVHPGEVIKMIQECGFSAAGLRLYFYLEMRSLQDQNPDVETICQDLKISRSTFKKWLPEIQDWSRCADWIKLPTRQGPERIIQLRLHKELGGKMEAYTPIGPIDLVTTTEIIEIKKIEDWKTAFGQVVAKSQTFPSHTKRIHLFGESSKQLKKITAHCHPFDVVVTFEKAAVEG
jgi:hypothetical protein